MATMRGVRPRGLVFDPFAGASGDMILGALLDLGLEREWLESLVSAIEPAAAVRVERVVRGGIACDRVRFDLPADPPARRLADVLAVVESSPVPGAVRERAAGVFRRIARVEAEVHGVGEEEVHFHEVGALDSILDVVAVLAGVGELGYERFYTRPIAIGSGTAKMEHGEYPLPAPATAKLLSGLPVRETGHPEECTTPTGAALIAALTAGARPPSEVVVGRSGYGAGSRDPADRPNCLRLLEVHEGARGDRLLMVVADIDDLAPEYVASARDDVLSAGAVDCALVRVDMKKGRPGIRLEALVPESELDAVSDVVFRGTTTIGMRYWPVERVTLERGEETVEWRGRRIRGKRVRLPDGQARWKPEHDDVVAAARATGLTAHEVKIELDAMERGSSDSVEERGPTE